MNVGPRLDFPSTEQLGRTRMALIQNDSRQGLQEIDTVLVQAKAFGDVQQQEEVNEEEEEEGEAALTDCEPWTHGHRYLRVAQVEEEASVHLVASVEPVFHCMLMTYSMGEGILNRCVSSATVVAWQEEHVLASHGESRSQVFELVSGHVAVALSHFGLYTSSEHMAGFLGWLASYHDLFSAPCCGCGRLLQFDSDERQLLPPTVRTYKGGRAFHPQCLHS